MLYRDEPDAIEASVARNSSGDTAAETFRAAGGLQIEPFDSNGHASRSRVQSLAHAPFHVSFLSPALAGIVRIVNIVSFVMESR